MKQIWNELWSHRSPVNISTFPSQVVCSTKSLSAFQLETHACLLHVIANRITSSYNVTQKELGHVLAVQLQHNVFSYAISKSQ